MVWAMLVVHVISGLLGCAWWFTGDMDFLYLAILTAIWANNAKPF